MNTRHLLITGILGMLSVSAWAQTVPAGAHPVRDTVGPGSAHREQGAPLHELGPGTPTPTRPLNLRLPPDAARPHAMPARGASVASAAQLGTMDKSHARSKTHAPSPAHAAQPGVYYGDTSGRPARADLAEVPTCDDSTYNEPQVHGSVGMGVVAGSHVSGNYQAGRINVSKALGSCEHPSGGVSISIGVEQGDSHHPGHRRH